MVTSAGGSRLLAASRAAVLVGAPLLVGVLAFALCRTALLPGVAFWDTAEFQAVGPLLGTAHPTGFPAYVVLGWLASVVLRPFGEPAFRMNLLSALLVAGAAAVTVVLVRLLTRSTLIGIAAGFGLAATPIAWTIGTHADPHALHLLLVAVLLALLVAWERPFARRDDDAGPVARNDRYLVAAAAVFGVALANHSLTLLLIVPVGLYVLAVDHRIWRRGRVVAACLIAVVATTALLYLELPLRAGILRAPLVYADPSTWDGFTYIVLAEQFRGSIVDPLGDLPQKFATLVDLVVAQFGILAALLPVGFLVTAVRLPKYALLTGLAAAITCFFAASYVNADITRYYLGPALIAWTWLAILAGVAVDAGADAIAWDRPRLHANSRAAAAFLAVVVLLVPSVAALHDRSGRVDESLDTSAQQWTNAALGAMDRDAVVVSWWSYSTPLWYAQRVEGRRPDIAIVDDRTRLDEHLGEVTDVIDAQLGRRPVYVIRSNETELAALAARYRLESVTPGAPNLLRVDGTTGARP
ncbi:MAG: protein O-mannosyl-transferase family [Chloroflexota bacterium]